MSALDPREQRFIDGYLKHGVGNKAVIEAGYSASGASVTAHRLLKRPKVAAELARRRAPIEKKSTLNAERVMEEIARIALFDPAQLYGPDGQLLAITDMPEDARRAIAGIEEGVTGKASKIRIASKLGGLELAAKILQMVRTEQNTQAAVQIIIAQPVEKPELPAVKPLLTPSW